RSSQQSAFRASFAGTDAGARGQPGDPAALRTKRPYPYSHAETRLSCNYNGTPNRETTRVAMIYQPAAPARDIPLLALRAGNFATCPANSARPGSSSVRLS